MSAEPHLSRPARPVSAHARAGSRRRQERWITRQRAAGRVSRKMLLSRELLAQAEKKARDWGYPVTLLLEGALEVGLRGVTPGWLNGLRARRQSGT